MWSRRPSVSGDHWVPALSVSPVRWSWRWSWKEGQQKQLRVLWEGGFRLYAGLLIILRELIEHGGLSTDISRYPG